MTATCRAWLGVVDRPIAWRQLPRYPRREPNVYRCLRHFGASQRCAAIARFAKRRSNMSAQITPAQLPVGHIGFGAMRITGQGVWGPPRDESEAIALLRRVTVKETYAPQEGVRFPAR